MIIYFVKTIILLAVYYALYVLLLRKIKSFGYRRIYLMFTALLAMVLPWMHAGSLDGYAEKLKMQSALGPYLEQMERYADVLRRMELGNAKLVFGIYVVGVVYGLLRIGLGWVVLHRLRLGAIVTQIGGVEVYMHEHIQTVFSFGKRIYVPQSSIKDVQIACRIAEQKAHVAGHHSRDKIFFAIVETLLWCNPMIYLYDRQMQYVHEYEADAKAMEELAPGVYVKEYLSGRGYEATPTMLVHARWRHDKDARIGMLERPWRNAMVAQLLIAVCLLVVTILALML